MPKKRHQTRYSKPQSTAPASLSSSSAARLDSQNGDHERPSVNALLASLRRTRLNGDTLSATVVDIAAPSVPPQIREILRLPEPGPAPPPRRRPRFGPRLDADGRRLPPGPAPPRSWLSLSRHAPKLRLDFSDSSVDDFDHRLIPGLYRPGYGSLVDIVLHKITRDWEFQRSYNVHYVCALPDHTRMALISYLTTIHGPGLSLSDLRCILSPPQISEDDNEDPRAHEHPTSFNEGITHLDLSTSVGRSLKLRELSQLLFSSESTRIDLPPESWDADEASHMPRPLLPNLTHLSLAADPESNACSWRQLLSLSTHLPTLTHLSLAFWPVPCMAPSLTTAKIVANGLTFQAGGTSLYSHTLDNEWSEQILILRKLSQSLYGLEYLDLTGCNAWFKALTASADGDQVDWVGDWGKMTHLIMTTGYAPPLGFDMTKTENFNEVVDMATSVEKTVRNRRAGRGRRFSVERDTKVVPIPPRPSPLAGF